MLCISDFIWSLTICLTLITIFIKNDLVFEDFEVNWRCEISGFVKVFSILSVFFWTWKIMKIIYDNKSHIQVEEITLKYIIYVELIALAASIL